jgi:hypothetical protein
MTNLLSEIRISSTYVADAIGCLVNYPHLKKNMSDDNNGTSAGAELEVVGIHQP